MQDKLEQADKLDAHNAPTGSFGDSQRKAQEGDCEWTMTEFRSRMEMLDPALPGHLDEAFNIFKKQFRREYQSKEEHEKRKAVFHENWQKVVNHNRKNLSYKMGLNDFSDLTHAEFSRMFTGSMSSYESRGRHRHSDS